MMGDNTNIDESRGLPRIRVAAVIARDDAILLVRHRKDNRDYWLLPGGGVEFGETLPEALVREVAEETGLEVAPRELLLVNDSIAPDGRRHIVHICFAAETTGGTLACRSDDRLQEARFVPLTQLPDITLYPDLREELSASVQGVASGGRYVSSPWKE